jgi:hypothetical protein
VSALTAFKAVRVLGTVLPHEALPRWRRPFGPYQKDGIAEHEFDSSHNRSICWMVTVFAGDPGVFAGDSRC